MPVIRALQAARPELRIDVLGLTTARSVLDAHGIVSLGFSDFVEPGDAQALEWGRELMAGQASGLVDPGESAAYLGLSFADLVAQHGERAARDLLGLRGRGSFCPVRTLHRVLDRIQPDLVVTTNSPRAEQAAVMAAGQRGIPALCMVDLFAVEEIKYIGAPGYASLVCVLDEHVRERFLAVGRPAREVLVTGNPAFDALAEPTAIAAGTSLRREMGGGKHVLWVSQPEPERHRITGVPGDPKLPRRIHAALAAAAAATNEWRLVIRPHPSEDPSLFRPGPNTVVSSQSDPLIPLLHAVDAVVCLTSTVGYEAALLGKPLVHLPMSIYREEADYTAMGLALPVHRLEGLEMALHSILSQGWRPSTRLQHAGGAARSVAGAIQGLLP